MSERIQITKPESEDDQGTQGSEGPKGDSSAEASSREKVLEKVRKLLRHAFDLRGNAAESKAAFDRARVLMEKNGIAFDEVKDFASPTEDDEEEPQPNDDIWRDVPEDDPNLWHAEVDGYQLIKELRKLVFRRYLVMKPEQELVCALWVLHAHAIAAAQHSPILLITAPTLGCGKSQLLECLEYLVPNPFATGDATAAAIFREIDHGSTLLIDEAETFLGETKQLRGILNTGHKRGGVVSRRDGRYTTWGPKAVALNGHLHKTLESRSIVIRMERKLKGERVASLIKPRLEDADNHLNALRRMCARWAYDNLDALRGTNPDLPAELEDRTGDNWRPLLAIADLCRWPKKARKAALTIEGERLRDEGHEFLLFEDLRDLFKSTSRLASQEIVASLVQLETRPWAEFMRGRPLTTTTLAHQLKPFRILPSEIKTAAGRRANGYRREQFADAFKRYLQK